MNDKARSVLERSSLIETREYHIGRLSSLFGRSHLTTPIRLDGRYGYADVDPFLEPELWVERSLEQLADMADTAMDREVFRPLCLEFGPYGVHFVDKLFGADVFSKEGQWYSRYLSSPIGELHAPDLEKSETWILAQRVAYAFLEHNLRLPYFGLPTIASALNIAVNLYGDQILGALYEEPESARRDLLTINNLLCTLHRWYIDHIPLQQLQLVVSGHRTQPPGYGQICGCTTQLLSEQLYREFIAPLDDELLRVYPNGGMIHLCGSHTQHLSTWRNMPSLRSVQLNDRAAEDLEHYFMGLRTDQMIYLNPCTGMPVEEAMRITGGEQLVIVG